MTRRDLIAAGSIAGLEACSKKEAPKEMLVEKSPVAIVKAASYEQELLARLDEGMKAAWPSAARELQDKRVVLKPNLVEFDEDTVINTDPRLVFAVRELFLKLGAREVWMGEGPGHRRDTWDLADQAGYRKIMPDFDSRFVDLNLDDVKKIKAFENSVDLYLPQTILNADLVVSVAKMKTHHWAGATLSMKNFFGVVPGAIYGWPKNFLHYQGIDRSIVELNRILRKTFAIVDGIVGMEGNGPIQGKPVAAGVMVMGRDVAAVDATCARLMKLDPLQMKYLRDASALKISGLGAIEERSIEQRGENLAGLARSFAVLPQFEALRLS
ncbi:DUF362 domain-containing protein [Bryobacter aggregatus]|uniref:DUF362 domain-containing protein n=1 Tax=Bryobacter aggregatus TaxID=360054 RepID=UPI0006904CC3|nr:DUF362 domain-containing protein [Bryobacter aggregatus]